MYMYVSIPNLYTFLYIHCYGCHGATLHKQKYIYAYPNTIYINDSYHIGMSTLSYVRPHKHTFVYIATMYKHWHMCMRAYIRS